MSRHSLTSWALAHMHTNTGGTKVTSIERERAALHYPATCWCGSLSTSCGHRSSRVVSAPVAVLGARLDGAR